MSLMPGNPPLADVDRPIDMMQDCHRRVERFLATLVRAGHEAPAPLDDEWRAAITTALNYFDNAAPLHTQDEEISLFPRLRMHADREDVARALVVVQQLERDHDVAHQLHEEHEILGRRWLSDDMLDPEDRERFVELSGQLQQIYVEHIRSEDEHVYVVARSVLGADELTQIGSEMRERRGGFCRERKAATGTLASADGAAQSIDEQD